MTSPLRPFKDTSVLAIEIEAPVLERALRRDLAGDADCASVVWTDKESTAEVATGNIRLALHSGLVLVDLPMMTDQTDIASLVIGLRVGASLADATLLAVTEQIPRGNAILAARWGTIAQDAVWQALLRTGESHLDGRSPQLELMGLFTEAGSLTYIFAEHVSLDTLRKHFADRLQLPTPDTHGESRVAPMVDQLSPSTRNKLW